MTIEFHPNILKLYDLKVPKLLLRFVISFEANHALRVLILHQSISPVPIPPGNHGAFVQKWVIRSFISSRRWGIYAAQGAPPPANLIHVVFKPLKARAVKLRV